MRAAPLPPPSPPPPSPLPAPSNSPTHSGDEGAEDAIDFAQSVAFDYLVSGRVPSGPVDAAHAALREDLRGVALALGEHVQCDDAYLAALHRDVIRNPPRAVFFVRGIFERILVHMTADPRPFCREGCRLAEVVAVALSMARGVHERERILCGLYSSLVRGVKYASQNVLPLLRLFAAEPTCRPMLRDRAMFSALSTTPFHEAVDLTLTILSGSVCDHEFETAAPMVHVCIELLTMATAPPKCAWALMAAFARRSAWRARLVHTTALVVSRHRGADWAEFLVEMLSDSSVDLVLRMHRNGTFTALVRANAIRARSAERGRAWRDLQAALRRHWPARVREAMGEPKDESEGCGPACPITLCACRRPAVASDGHVYERDALLHHMARNGPVSPLTRQTLEWHVFDFHGV